MTYHTLFKKTLVLYIAINFVFYLQCSNLAVGYNNPVQFKQKMESIVNEQAIIIQNIYQNRCQNVNITQCDIKSVILCQGTAQRQCLSNFPSLQTNQIPFLSKYSGISIPNIDSQYSLSQSQKQFICSTASNELQFNFQKVIFSNQYQYAWNYFGSSNGIIRRTPGSRYNSYDEATGLCADYDVRTRPWYTQAIYSRKNIIILLGVRNTITLSGGVRLNAMKSSVQAILDTTYLDDTITIITFSNTANYLLPNTTKLFDISSKYNNSNQTILSAYQNAIDKLQADAINANNYQSAFSLGFSTINATLSSGLSTTDSTEYIFMLFTDGDPDQGITNSSDLQNYINTQKNNLNTNLNLSGSQMIKISLIAFNINNNTAGQTLIVQDWSCLTNGMYIEAGGVTSQSYFFQYAQDLYDFYLLNNQRNQTVWSTLYEDKFGLGQMVTVTRQVYQIIDNQIQLIGVVGLDVRYSQFTKYSTSGVNITQLLANSGQPFVNTATDCQMQNIRKHKCKSINTSCPNPASFTCSTTISNSIFQNPVDTSLNIYCTSASLQGGIPLWGIFLIIGCVIILIIVVVLFAYFKKFFCFNTLSIKNKTQQSDIDKIKRERMLKQKQKLQKHQIKLNPNIQPNINSDEIQIKVQDIPSSVNIDCTFQSDKINNQSHINFGKQNNFAYNQMRRQQPQSLQQSKQSSIRIFVQSSKITQSDNDKAQEKKVMSCNFYKKQQGQSKKKLRNHINQIKQINSMVEDRQQKPSQKSENSNQKMKPENSNQKTQHECSNQKMKPESNNQKINNISTTSNQLFSHQKIQLEENFNFTN